MATLIRKFLFLLLFLFKFFFSFSQVGAGTSKKINSLNEDESRIVELLKLSCENRLNGLNEIALNHVDSALQISLTQAAKKYRPNVYNELGLVYQNKLEFDKALKNFLKAGELYEELKDSNGIAYVQNNIGEVYRYMRNYKKAIEYFSSGLNIRIKEGNASNIGSSELSLGAVYYDMNDLPKAMSYFKSALNAYRSIKDLKNIALMQNNLGSLNNELKKYSEAIENYKDAMHIFSQLKDSLDYSVCLANIGNVYNAIGNYKLGIDYCLKGLEVALRLDNKDIISSCYLFLSEGFQNEGDYKHAFEYQSKLASLKDTMYDLQTNQNIAEMQTRYDTEKKEKQNQILKQQNELQNLNLNRQKIINYSISLGLILMLVLAFYIYKNYRQKQKANVLLAGQNEEIRFQKNIIEEKKRIVEEKNKIVEEKNKDITDSIKYAKRIQLAFLPTTEFWKEFNDNGFILYKPKDIVSGDFYWMEKKDNKLLIAAVDCTGHGVPGAFMSIVGFNLLNQAVKEHKLTTPSLILDELNNGVTETLRQYEEDSDIKDGMDISLCNINYDSLEMQYACAYNPVWVIRDGLVIELKANKFPIGNFMGEELSKFTNNVFQLKKGDSVYLFSDGFADQFGGQSGKKFKYKPMQQLLKEIYHHTSKEQKAILESTFENWQGELEQVDDVLVIGIKI